MLQKSFRTTNEHESTRIFVSILGSYVVLNVVSGFCTQLYQPGRMGKASAQQDGPGLRSFCGGFQTTVPCRMLEAKPAHQSGYPSLSRIFL